VHVICRLRGATVAAIIRSPRNRNNNKGALLAANIQTIIGVPRHVSVILPRQFRANRHFSNNNMAWLPLTHDPVNNRLIRTNSNNILIPRILELDEMDKR
jgi:hypothetical protein